MDQRTVQSAIDGLRRDGGSCSVIVKNGKIVGEHNASEVNPAYSTGKSLIGTAIGAAIADGFLDLDSKGPKWTVKEHLQQFVNGRWDYEPLSGQNDAVEILDMYVGNGRDYIRKKILDPLGMKNTRFG